MQEGTFEVIGPSSDEIGDMAAAHGLTLHELTPMQASLEEAFMEITRNAVEFHGLTEPVPALAASQEALR